MYSAPKSDISTPKSGISAPKSDISAPKSGGRRSRKPGVDRKPRQAYSAKQLDMLEAEFKVLHVVKDRQFIYLLIMSVSSFGLRGL